MNVSPPDRNGRSVLINSDLLKKRRQGRGWTQRELAIKAGYSERLIRKAEKGESIQIATLRDIATALSTPIEPLTAEDLQFDPLGIAKFWIQAFNEHERQMVDHVAPFLSDDFVFSVPGQPDTVPFIGQWHGVEGLREFMNRYFDTFERQPPDETTYTVGENMVSARFMENGTMAGVECGPVRINLHFYFRGNQIVRIDDDYDILGGEATVKEAKTKLK